MGTSLVDVSAQEGARRVALHYLDQASAASAHLHDAEEVEALHDFRVGMRRLRSCLRAYDAILGRSVSDKQRRRLKRIASATNPGRDAEVQLDWVLQVGDSEHETRRHGVRWLAGKLQRAKDEAYGHVREELCGDFRRLDEKIRGPLSTYTIRHRVGKPSGPRFGAVAADTLALQMSELRADLDAVKSIEDEPLAHRARIHGKRLRYLLEPFRGEVEGTKELVRRLKAIQDLLGDLNDLHNLASTVGKALEESAIERARRLREIATQVGGNLDDAIATDERPGLLAMLQRIQSDRLRLFDSLLEEWLVPSGLLSKLESELDTVLARMRGTAGVEIERKYLLRSLPPICAGREATELNQGYLPGEKLIERVRRKRKGGREVYLRTVKSGAGLKRIEIEETCSAEVFHALFALTEGHRVCKRRYRVPDGDLVWEIDEFRDRELYLAEVELPHEDVEVTIPEWLEPHLEREVTDDSSYVNAVLAK